MIVRITCIAISLMLAGNISAQDIFTAIKKSEKLYKDKKYAEAIDILNDALENDNDEIPSGTVEARLGLARNYMHSWQANSARKEYAIAWELSKNLENDSLLIVAGTSLATMMGYYENPDSLKLLVDELLKHENLNYSDKSNLYIQLGGYYEDKEQIDSAIYYASLAAEIDSIHQDSSSIPYTYYDLGNFYVSNFEYKNGISKILYGIDFLRGEKDAYKRNTIDLGLSSIYIKIGNIEKAKQLATTVYESAKANNQHINLTMAYMTLGNCAAYTDQYEQALRYYELSDSVNQSKSKNVWRSVNAKASIITQKLNLGQSITDVDLSYIRSIDISESSNILRNKIEIIKLRTDNLNPKDFDTRYQKLYIQSGAEHNLGLNQSLLNIKKEYLTKQKKYKEALSVTEEIDKKRKEITLANNEYIIQDLEAKHQKKEQQLQINYLDEQNEAKEQKVQEQKNKIVIGSIALGLISLLSFFLFRLYRQVRNQKEIITKALTEKDLLLREIHHRVKNNLQLVSSLLTLQGRSINDATALQAINEGKSRVRSMALIHQDLYNKENLTGINVKEYIEKLSQELFDTYNVDKERIRLQMKIEKLEMDVDTLIPLGLIINELITNSLKYAWPNNTTGTLYIELQHDNNHITLTVKDDGIGYDPTSAREGSFGATLISALTLQLNAEYTVNTDNGSTITIILDKSDIT